MCRICGRMVKCIFDTMPSRIFTMSSRRTLTTVRRIPSPPKLAASSNATALKLTRAFSALALTSRTRRIQVSPSTPILPAPQSPKAVPLLLLSRAHIRPYSSTSALGTKRWTYNPSRRVQKRRHGFLARLKTTAGRNVLKRRAAKRRTNLSW